MITLKTLHSLFKIHKKIIIKALHTLLLSFALFTTHSFAAEQNLDSIAAVVNNDIIMVSEVRTAAARFKTDKVNASNQQSFLKEVLEKLIMNKIQVQRAKEIGIKIDDAALDQAMLSIAAQNKLDLQQFRVALIKEGLDYKDFRESIRDRLYTETLLKRQQGRNNKISENEVDDLIQAESFNLSKGVEYHLIDILVPNKNTKTVQQFNKNLRTAQNIRKNLLTKTDISPAAIQKMGASSKDLGWKNAQSLSPAFIRSLSLLGVGELSTVVRDTQGFHILKLVDQRGSNRKQTSQVRARHILISNTEPQARLKATQIRNQLLAGENFADLAQSVSADKGSAKNGGELPMTTPATYVPPFAAAVKTLPLNTLSQPIETRFGWHLIEVLERQNTDETRESIKIQAQSLISEKKKNTELNNWLQSLRDQAFVEYKIAL